MTDSTEWTVWHVIRVLALTLVIGGAWFFVASTDLPFGLKVALDILLFGPLAASIGGLPWSYKEERRREEEIQRALRDSE